jgi:protein-tyrosine phosphatase
MRRVAASHGLKYSGRARQFNHQDFDKFDVVIAMDTSNRNNLTRMTSDPAQIAKVHLMRDFDPQAGENASVPDPYYGGIDGFEDVYWLVERSCQGLLDALENGELG